MAKSALQSAFFDFGWYKVNWHAEGRRDVGGRAFNTTFDVLVYVYAVQVGVFKTARQPNTENSLYFAKMAAVDKR